MKGFTLDTDTDFGISGKKVPAVRTVPLVPHTFFSLQQICLSILLH